MTDFYRSVTLRPDAVPEFAGGVYDLGRSRPEHLRMVSWARLEGVTLEEPHADGRSIFEHAIAAIETAQVDGYVDRSWEPTDLLALLFGIGLAWANAPDPDPSRTGPVVIARQRAAAVEAARRIVSDRCG